MRQDEVGKILIADNDEDVEEKPAKRAKAEEHDEDEDREPRSFVSLGWLYHFLYSVKARIALLPMLLLELLPWRRRRRVIPLRHDPSAVTAASLALQRARRHPAHGRRRVRHSSDRRGGNLPVADPARPLDGRR